MFLAKHSAPMPAPTMACVDRGAPGSLCSGPGDDAQRRNQRKQGRKSVEFSPSVSLRTYFEDDARPSSWLRKDELDESKRRARELAKRHLRARVAGGNPTCEIADAVRYEFQGESLRGMEYITNVAHGRKRRIVQAEAIRAVVEERLNRLDSRPADKETEIDPARSAESYGAKAREALLYARRVAEEDAKVAAATTAEDDGTSSPRHVARRHEHRDSPRDFSQPKGGRLGPALAPELQGSAFDEFSMTAVLTDGDIPSPEQAVASLAAIAAR